MSNIVYIFSAGGFVMYPLVLFFIVAIMIGIERALLYRRCKRELKGLQKTLKSGPQWVMMATVLERDSKEFGTLLAEPIRSAHNYMALENRLQDVVGYVDERLKRGLSWLSMIVTMAPLLGLLGTVMGMIRAFAVVGNDLGAPALITGGVSEALIATATGLMVAIVALAFHSYAATQVNDMIVTLEHECGHILDAYNEDTLNVASGGFDIPHKQPSRTFEPKNEGESK